MDYPPYQERHEDFVAAVHIEGGEFKIVFSESYWPCLSFEAARRVVALTRTIVAQGGEFVVVAIRNVQVYLSAREATRLADNLDAVLRTVQPPLEPSLEQVASHVFGDIFNAP